MITAKRQSQPWATGDEDHWVKTYPRYYSDGELIDDLPTWAMCMATEGVCKELCRQLIELFRRSPRNYRITGGHFKVSEETDAIFHRKVVDLTLVVSDEEKGDSTNVPQVKIPEDIEKVDLHIVGNVQREECPMWDYADILDEDGNSLLAVPLLEFEGKRIEISIRVDD